MCRWNGFIRRSGSPRCWTRRARCGATAGDEVAGAGARPVLRIDGLDVSGRSAEAITDADRLAALGVDNTAYVIFTSGSTGVPKGVAVSHAGLLGWAAAKREMFGLGADARVLMVSSPTFDASIGELLWAVGSGAALVLAPPQVYAGEPLTALLQDQQVNAAILTPTVVSTLDRARLTCVDTLIAVGEACLPELVDAWAPDRRMFNGYGPSETTIWVTCAPLSAGQPIRIGAPIPGVCALVLDAWLSPAPVGVVGELYLGGPALAHGYLGRAELTAERFVANPYGGFGTRMYRTGDLVRWTPDGTLDCRGRADTQIKLRGQRIELGEIENTLLACPQVTQAAATVQDSTTGGAQLVAYISGVPQPDPAAVRQWLGAWLPDYMVPAQIVVLDEFPLTSSGKIDRKALPAPVFAAKPFRAPQTETEKIVAGIYAQVLGVERVGVDDSFFELGGDSLSAMRVITAINTSLDAHLAVRTLFDAPSVESLCQQLGRPASSVEIVPVETFKEGTGVPLICIHPAGGFSWGYRALCDYLDCPIIGIQQVPLGEEAEPGSVRSMAESYADRLQALYPTGPYNLLGYSFGGVVAHELAIELRRRGCAVQRLILLDAALNDKRSIAESNQALDESQILEEILRSIWIDVPEESKPLTFQKAEDLIRQREEAMGLGLLSKQAREFLEFIVQNVQANELHQSEHVPCVFDGDMVIFSAAQRESDSSLLQSWRPYVAGDITEYSIDCKHEDLMTAESLSLYGQQLKFSLEA